MEWEYNGKTYWLEWYSHEEVFVTDEDGNDIEDHDVMEAAYQEVWDWYVGRAEMMMDMARDQEMGL